MYVSMVLYFTCIHISVTEMSGSKAGYYGPPADDMINPQNCEMQWAGTAIKSKILAILIITTATADIQHVAD